MSRYNTWVRKTHEKPLLSKLRGVRYSYDNKGNCTGVSALAKKPSSVELEALKRAKEKASSV